MFVSIVSVTDNHRIYLQKRMLWNFAMVFFDSPKTQNELEQPTMPIELEYHANNRLHSMILVFETRTISFHLCKRKTPNMKTISYLEMKNLFEIRMITEICFVHTYDFEECMWYRSRYLPISNKKLLRKKHLKEKIMCFINESNLKRTIVDYYLHWNQVNGS